jgi:hypothetical protein
MAERNGLKCGAKRTAQQTCTLPAGWGTDHVGAGRCRKHFGNAPNVARSAAKEQAETEARAVLAQLDVYPVLMRGCLGVPARRTPKASCATRSAATCGRSPSLRRIRWF